jgi:MFS family permease
VHADVVMPLLGEIEKPSQSSPPRQQRFPGWSVVCVAFTTALFAAGVGTYGPSIYLHTLHTVRGWSISWISAAITAHFLLSAAVVTWLPELHHALGLARSTAAGAVLMALGICIWATAHELWQLLPAAMLSGSGFALIGGAAVNAMVARWFDRDRPKALSMALNGASVGGVILPPLWVLLIAKFGFQWAAVAVGVTMVCLIVPLAFRFLRLGPTELGLLPDGRPLAVSPPKAAARLSRAGLLRDKRFKTISLAFALGLFAQIGVFAHMVERLASGLGAGGAAAALSLTTTCAVLGRTVLGWTIGERDRRQVASINFLIQAAGVLLLCFGSNFLTVIPGCILFGLGVGNLFSLPPLIAQAEFSAADVGTIVALVTAINQAVFGLAPAIFGVLHDATASYAIPFALGWILEIVASLVVLAGRR